MNKEQAKAALATSEANGFAALRGGLGLPDGNYSMVTPNSESIFGVKEVTAKDGKKYALTLVAGSIKGKDETNKNISETYGIGDKDKQLVVTYDQWNGIDPNQTYDIAVAKGRIASIALVSASVLAEA